MKKDSGQTLCAGLEAGGDVQNKPDKLCRLVGLGFSKDTISKPGFFNATPNLPIFQVSQQRIVENLNRVQRLAAGTVVDLVAATGAGGGNDHVGSQPAHGREQH